MSTFTAYTIESAAPDAQKILANIEAGYGFVPNLFAYMAEAPVTLDAYLALNQLLGKSSLTPAQAQTALLTVSVENECDFCSVAHRALGKRAGVKHQTIEAILAKSSIEDPKDQALVNLARTIVRERGWVPEATLNEFFSAGFTKQQVFEVILAVTIKTLSNYINHLTKPEPNPELVAML